MYRERGRVAFTALDATLCSASIELSGIKLARLDCQSTAALLYINTYPPIGRGRVPIELSWYVTHKSAQSSKTKLDGMASSRKGDSRVTAPASTLAREMMRGDRPLTALPCFLLTCRLAKRERRLLRRTPSSTILSAQVGHLARIIGVARWIGDRWTARRSWSVPSQEVQPSRERTRTCRTR